MLDLTVRVDGQVAERAEVSVAAGDRNVDVDLRVPRGARQITAGLNLIAGQDVGAPCTALEMLGCAADRQRRRRIAGRKLEQIAVRVGIEVAALGRFVSAVARQSEVRLVRPCERVG